MVVTGLIEEMLVIMVMVVKMGMTPPLMSW